MEWGLDGHHKGSSDHIPWKGADHNSKQIDMIPTNFSKTKVYWQFILISIIVCILNDGTLSESIIEAFENLSDMNSICWEGRCFLVGSSSSENSDEGKRMSLRLCPIALWVYKLSQS